MGGGSASTPRGTTYGVPGWPMQAAAVRAPRRRDSTTVDDHVRDRRMLGTPHAHVPVVSDSLDGSPMKAKFSAEMMALDMAIWNSRK